MKNWSVPKREREGGGGEGEIKINLKRDKKTKFII